MDEENDENVEIHLLNSETGIKYAINVSPSDAKRARNDTMFATHLLEIAKLQFDETSSISATSEDAKESMFKWSHAATLFLVEEYRLQENNLTSGKISQKKVWNNIAAALSAKGYNVTGPQCLSKFHGMKRTYKSIKDHNAKSGNNPRTWPYMEIMESLLGERPFMSPPAIASSSGIHSSSKSDSESSSVSINASSDVDLYNPYPRKQSTKNKVQENTLKIAESIIKSREIAEKNRDQKHREKMEFRKEMLGFMQKLLDKM